MERAPIMQLRLLVQNLKPIFWFRYTSEDGKDMKQGLTALLYMFFVFLVIIVNCI